uniref:Polynucleotidyl transferase, Ribonuclease H fold n=1 Tax=Medicago truncatula TaxID=3880 RepID=Q2HUH1_MEDTR|nr:Polynucleotidyl transferase, Ribonuclease H fold [Medicago truncatula]
MRTELNLYTGATIACKWYNRTAEQRRRKRASWRLKCYVDDSFSTSRNRAGIDMCIRDEEEWYVLSKTLRITPLCSVKVGEALGPYHTMLWINDIQLTNVNIEVDSKEVIDYYVRNRGDSTEFSLIY